MPVPVLARGGRVSRRAGLVLGELASMGIGWSLDRAVALIGSRPARGSYVSYLRLLAMSCTVPARPYGTMDGPSPHGTPPIVVVMILTKTSLRELWASWL